MKLKQIAATATLEDVKAGTRAMKVVQFRLANVAPQPEDADPDAPDPALCRVGLRVLTGSEIARAYEKAQIFATQRGVAEWKDQHPICILALMVQTLAIACIDPDTKEPEFFFENAEEILNSPLIGPDNINFLNDLQRDWQDACSLQKSEMDANEVWTIIGKMAAGEADDPLALLRPGTRASFMRTLGSLCIHLLAAKSPTGSTSSSDGTSGSNETGSDPANEDLRGRVTIGDDAS